MPGTVRKIIERIKEKRSGGNSVVALTVETRLVLQGFDPQRFEYDTADDAGRLARIAEIAEEMGVDISDLLAEADVAPDPEAAPAPPPRPEGGGVSEAARAAAVAASAGTAGAAPASTPTIPDDHPLQKFRQLADSLLVQVGTGEDGSNSGASFAVLVKASVLMALYSIHKDSVFCDLLRYDALFQWFLGLSPEQARFEADAFFDDRERALNSDVSRKFFDKLVPAAGRDKLFAADVLQASSADFKSWMTPRGTLK